MGNKFRGPANKKTKDHLKVLILGISGSGKSTFTKQMKIIHQGGFSKEEVMLYKEVLLQNIIIGMKELVKQAEKLELQVTPTNRKHSRFFLEYNTLECQWEPKMGKKVRRLWEDPALQQAWKAAPGYQLQMTHMDYLMARLEVISAAEYIPTNEDMLHARQRTTGAQSTIFTKDKVRWELIDVGGQKPERAKWELVINEGAHAIIFFAGLDEFNMLSVEEKEKKTKMDLSMEVFAEVLNAQTVKGTCCLLFLNKVDLFEKKIKDPKIFKEFQKAFPKYKGAATLETCCNFVQDAFKALIEDENTADVHTHITCALDTEAMTTVFEAVKGNIFLKRIEALRLNF